MRDEYDLADDQLIAEAYNADLKYELDTVDIEVTNKTRYLCTRQLFKDLGFSKEAIYTLTDTFNKKGRVHKAISDAVLNEVVIRLLKDKIRESESESIEAEISV